MNPNLKHVMLAAKGMPSKEDFSPISVGGPASSWQPLVGQPQPTPTPEPSIDEMILSQIKAKVQRGEELTPEEQQVIKALMQQRK